ncbi:hypothetical protein OIU79_019020 [Salix purpurea]|uniref:Uncharacterized protein n=1 Tax=Salix purpurea TaxID=77065 RepID=A0A9Q0SJD3_SALPP|nr:hypothetical protein OIU79_019020 [Salix purpurea]
MSLAANVGYKEMKERSRRPCWEKVKLNYTNYFLHKKDRSLSIIQGRQTCR